jgi:hypothetical protein
MCKFCRELDKQILHLPDVRQPRDQLTVSRVKELISELEQRKARRQMISGHRG